LTGSNNPKLRIAVADAIATYCLPSEFVDDRRRGQPLAGVEVQRCFPVFGVERQDVAIVVSRNTTPPALETAPAHMLPIPVMVTPGALAVFGLSVRQRHLAALFVAPPPANSSSEPASAMSWYTATLLQGDDIQQPGSRVIRRLIQLVAPSRSGKPVSPRVWDPCRH